MGAALKRIEKLEQELARVWVIIEALRSKMYPPLRLGSDGSELRTDDDDIPF
mgnify:CR=1 FL=1